MVNFRQLVESVILLSEGQISSITDPISGVNDFLFNYKKEFKTISSLDKSDLDFIYSQIKLPSIAGKNWRYSMQCFPLFFAIVSGYKSIQEANKVARPLDVDEFYKDVNEKFKDSSTDNTAIENLLNNNVQEYPTKGIKPPGDAYVTYRNAVAQDSYEVLRQDVWPLINKMTITNAVSNLIQTRLSGMEKLQLKFAFFPPLNVLKKEGSFDKILEKAIINYNNFIRGQYGFSQDFQSVLQEIDITAKDFADLIHYVREVMKGLMSAKLRLDNPDSDPATGFPDDKLLEKVNKSIKQNSFVLKFCKEGILNFYDKDDKIQTILDAASSEPIIYDLEKIEELGTEESNKLIEIIKEMSTGVRTKSQAWQKFKEERFQYLVQAASSIAGFGGAKLYG
jgi:hypothetical protein